MNIYKVIMTHAAPKDNKCAIKEYIIAKDDVEVFEYLKSTYTYWNDYEEYKEEEDWKETLDSIFENKGDSHLDSKWCALYYGSTMYNWELFKENVSIEDILVLEKLEIAKVVTK